MVAGGTKHFIEDFQQKMAKTMVDLAEGILTLAIMIKEQFVSGRFELWWVEPGVQFVQEDMEELEDPGDAMDQDDRPVLCTVSLGLRHYGQKGAVGESSTDREQMSVVAKPKVVTSVPA